MLFRCAMAEGDEEAVGALLRNVESPAELLAVLDERGLSLAEFSQQVGAVEAREGLEKMGVLLAAAAELVEEARGDPPMAELELLALDRGYRELVKRLLPGLWERTGSDGVLRLVGRLQPEGGVEALLVGWEERTPDVRTRILETLLSNEAWTMELLRRPEVKACDAAMRARLTEHPKEEIAVLAEKVFSGASSQTRRAVLEMYEPALKRKGDAVAGKVVFARACISCHRLDGVGIDLGPDLRSVAQHDGRKLLNSILDPSAIIEPGFMAYHCKLTSGEALYGVIATETGASLTLRLAGNSTRSVLRSEIESLKSTGMSLMPEGLEAALTVEALADLIAYLQVVR
ncbi:MAG: c-type cytochrome, partial [Verrucomicrobiales bacterium]|nr:c-type cytochrome [Verrucomicrobiales bacterium]